MIGDEEQPGENEVVPVPTAKGENRIAFGGLETLSEDEEEDEVEDDELAPPVFRERVSSLFLSDKNLEGAGTGSIGPPGKRCRSGSDGPLTKGPSLFFQRAAAASTRSGLHNTSMDTIAFDRHASIQSSKEDFGDNYREKTPFCTVKRAVAFFFVATLLGVIIYLAYIFIDVKFEEKGSGGVTIPTISLDTDATSQSRTQVISEEVIKVNVGDIGEPITAGKLADLVETHLKVQPQSNAVDVANLFSVETEDGDTFYCGVIVDGFPVVIECLHTMMWCQVYLYELGSPFTNCGASSS